MANAERLITVEVVYARPEAQDLVRLQLPAGSTLLEAVQRSGLLERHADIDLQQGSFGIFSKREKDPASRRLQEGERVEIYRPLRLDPKEARRARAEKVRARRAQAAD